MLTLPLPRQLTATGDGLDSSNPVSAFLSKKLQIRLVHFWVIAPYEWQIVFWIWVSAQLLQANLTLQAQAVSVRVYWGTQGPGRMLLQSRELDLRWHFWLVPANSICAKMDVEDVAGNSVLLCVPSNVSEWSHLGCNNRLAEKRL